MSVVAGTEHKAEFCVANLHCVRQQRIEHRLQIARRGTDNRQHIGGSGLLLQVDFAQFVEQPRVLDGDHGLVGKVVTRAICLSANGLLPAGKRQWRRSVAFFEHWHHNKRSNAGHIDSRDNHEVAFRIARLIF